MAILVYGSFVPDIVFRVPRLPRRGEDVPASEVQVLAAGGGGNVAVALAAWGYDVRAGGNSVGDDPLGAWMAGELSRRSIATADGYVSPSGVTAPNGILVTPDGERTIVGHDYRRVTWLPVRDWDDIDTVMVDAYSGEAGTGIIEEGAGRGLPIVGTDRAGREIARLRVLLWSADEHPDPAAARSAASSGPWVAVTHGGGPIAVYGPGGEQHEIRPRLRVPRDSTGAGDVFAAAVVAGTSDGIPLLAALERAADTAGRYVAAGRRADVPPLTRMDP